MWIVKPLLVAFLAGFVAGSDEGAATYGIEDAIRSAIEELRNQLKNGIPEMNIPPLDPMDIKYQKIDLFLEDVLKLEGSISNVTGNNLLSFNITKLKANLTPISLEIRADWDSIDARGRYEIDGNLINIIPVYGNGTFRGDFGGVFGYLRIDIGSKAGKLVVKKFDVDFGVRNVTIGIENFLGGLLGDIICEMANENLPTMVEQFKMGYLEDIKGFVVKELNGLIGDKTAGELVSWILELLGSQRPGMEMPELEPEPEPEPESVQEELGHSA